MSEDLFTRPETFMGVPYSHDFSKARAAVVGVPFDCGVHPFRVGARQGPRSVREQSKLVRRFNPELSDFDPAARLGTVDCGDVRLTPGQIQDAFSCIEGSVASMVKHGVTPIAVGGDGSISYPLLRAVAQTYSNIALVHIDAHTDTTPPTETSTHNAGTQFYRAATEGLVDTLHSYHIGMRGTTYLPNGFPRTRDLGYQVIPQSQLLHRGFWDVVSEVRTEVGEQPVYLCWDMDVFDPSCAPGVCAPSWGGLSAREGIDLVRLLTGMHVVAFDINTVSPPHDVRAMTAFLAAAMIYEFEVLLCRYHGLDQPEVVGKAMPEHSTVGS